MDNNAENNNQNIKKELDSYKEQLTAFSIVCVLGCLAAFVLLILFVFVIDIMLAG